MTQYTEGPCKAFTLGEAMSTAFVRVKADTTAGQVKIAGVGEDWIGTLEEAGASGDVKVVRLRTAAGTRKVVAAGAFSVGAILYGAASGYVDDVPKGKPVGRALEAATASGDVVEVLPVTDMSGGSSEPFEVIGGAGDIAANDLVYGSDQTADVLTVLKAQGTSAGLFAQFVCPNAITAAAKGVALKQYLLSGIDTDGSAVGDPVYLSDAAAGGYTLTKPTGTDKVQVVGRVVEAHATTGAIFFDLTESAQIVHTHADNAEGGQLDTDAPAVHSTSKGAIPFVVAKTVAGAGTTHIWDAAVPRKCTVIDAWSRNESANDGTWKLNDGSNDITDAVSVAASDLDVDRAGQIDDSKATLSAADTLDIVHTGTGFAATVYVLLLPVS